MKGKILFVAGLGLGYLPAGPQTTPGLVMGQLPPSPL